MTHGLARYDFYLKQLGDLLARAAEQNEPGKWLYQNNARTVFFMLEGLAKAYASIHNRKRFSKMKEQFKELEDALGAVDYYDCYFQEFSSNIQIPSATRDSISKELAGRLLALDTLLVDKNWLGADSPKLGKIRKKLESAGWLEPEKEVKGLLELYLSSINDINEFLHKEGLPFRELENQVHELRRALRWLSIYTICFQGMIQLTDSDSSDPNTQKYLTEEVIQSPFNKLPEVGNNEYLLLLEKDYFLSLSWMISYLGKVKDRGLRIFALSEALRSSNQVAEDQALPEACRMLGEPVDALSQILGEASSTTGEFVKDGILDKLLHATVKISR